MKRILVVEDDRRMRTMLKDMLEMAGYEVVSAEDGLEALKICRRQRADLVITDIIMPDKEGLETISELRRDFPETKIIAISGGGQIGPHKYLKMARMLGAQKTFTKPFAITDLLGGVRELCGEAR